MRVCVRVCLGLGFRSGLMAPEGGGGTVGLAGSFVNAENLSSRSVVIIVIIIMTTIVDVHVRKRG